MFEVAGEVAKRRWTAWVVTILATSANQIGQWYTVPIAEVCKGNLPDLWFKAELHAQ